MRHSPNEIWLEILLELGDAARENIFLKQTKPITLRESQFTVSVPALYTLEQIEDRFLPAINDFLEKRVRIGCRLNITVVQPDVKPPAGPPEAVLPPTENSLNPKYTFDRFVVGTSNRLSHAAALAGAENPGKIYNPLFIYGGVGLGKTHLLHAVGNHIQEHHSHLKVLYVTSETFMNEFIDSIKARTTNARTTTQDFRNKYRTADVLLIDDIQFLQRKEGTQEEFFRTFNELHRNSNHIVMTSDRPPKNLETVEERLRSRFEWGMVADIGPPEFESRVAILRQKCEDHSFENIHDSVLSHIAEIVQTNIRELEGTLIRLVTESSVFDEELTVEFAARVLSPLTTQPPIPSHKAVTADDIQKAVANYFELKVSDLKSSTRTKVIVRPRQISMYLCRELTNLSLTEIARAFNKRDHTTVLHAYNQIEQRIPSDQKLNQIINILTADIK